MINYEKIKQRVIEYLIFTQLSHSFHITITKWRYNAMTKGQRALLKMYESDWKRSAAYKMI